MIKALCIRALSLLLVFHLALAAVALRFWVEARYPQHLPWVPLEVAHDLGLTTRGKLLALQGNLPTCIATLRQAQLLVNAIEHRAAAPHCEIPDAVRLQQMHYPYEPASAPMSCPLAAMVGLWERHVVQPAAELHLAVPVARIRHYGTYNCRTIAGSSRGSWSQHATATAIDIAAFELTDGRTISVLRDYHDEGPVGDFLRAVKQGGCTVFGTVLSPEYNSAHADHFHMQQSGGLCR